MSSTATKKVGMGIASTIIKSLSPPLTPFTHAYRVPLKRDFPKHWKQPNTSVRLDKLPLLPMLPSTHADLPMRHDSLTMNRKISGGQPKPWKYYAFVGDRCCSVYAAVILQKSACDNRIRSQAAAAMVTNAVNARVAWSYGLEAELKIAPGQENIRDDLKANETLYEAYIGVLYLASLQYPEYTELLSAYMEQFFSKAVFPDILALKSIPTVDPRYDHRNVAKTDRPHALSIAGNVKIPDRRVRPDFRVVDDRQ